MNEKFYEDDEIEIDLREVLFALRKRIVLICIVSVLGALLSFGITKLFITPMYTVENSFLVLTKETTLTSLADLQIGSQLTNDYSTLTTSRPVLEAVIAKLNLDMTYQELEEIITITNPNDTRILTISVEYEDPQMALEIVRNVAQEASDFISEIMEVIPPKIIDDGVLPEEPTSPSTIKNTLIGLVLAAFLCSGIVVLMAVLDDTIKTESDVEKYLAIPTLSSVPDRRDFINRDKEKGKDKNGDGEEADANEKHSKERKREGKQ